MFRWKYKHLMRNTFNEAAILFSLQSQLLYPTEVNTTAQSIILVHGEGITVVGIRT